MMYKPAINLAQTPFSGESLGRSFYCVIITLLLITFSLKNLPLFHTGVKCTELVFGYLFEYLLMCLSVPPPWPC